MVRGKAEGLQKVSIGAFGHLEAIDRAEIESYSAIKELIIEFMENPRPQIRCVLRSSVRRDRENPSGSNRCSKV